MHLEGKVAIITGGSSGIGEAVAKRFLEHGASVAACARHKRDLEKAFKKYPEDRVLLFECDVSSDKEAKQLVEATVKKFKKIDVLVNNAGIYVEGKVGDIAYKDWQKQMLTNLDGVFLMSHYAIPYLVKTKGNIINTASVSGLGGDEEAVAYNASKGAIVNFTRAMAIDYGPQGVRINSICPSLTETELTKDMIKDKKLVKAFKDRIPLRRIAQPDDIAGAYLFLAGDDARFVTGVNLPVDGGVGASNGQPIYTD